VSNSQNNLTLSLVQQDVSAVSVLNRTIGPIQYAGLVGQHIEGLVVGAAPVAVTLPTTNVLQVVVKNTHATLKLTVTWTPQGGASAIVAVLEPGGIVVLWNPATSATAGITALTLTGSGAGVTVELFLGG